MPRPVWAVVVRLVAPSVLSRQGCRRGGERAQEGGLGLRDVTAFQPIEELLEGELRRVRRARIDAARYIERADANGQGRRDGNGDGAIERGKRTARGDTEHGCAGALSRETASEWDEVSVDSHQGARSVDRDCRRRDFVRPRERVAAATDIESPANRSEEIAACLPDHAIRELPLHLQTLLALHPGIDGLEHIARSSGNRPASADTSAAEQLGAQSALVRRESYSRAFLSERLTEMLRRKSNLFAQLENLRFGEYFLRLAGASLQFRRAREHALERAPVQTGGNVGCGEIRVACHTAKYTVRLQTQIPPST